MNILRNHDTRRYFFHPRIPASVDHVLRETGLTANVANCDPLTATHALDTGLSKLHSYSLCHSAHTDTLCSIVHIFPPCAYSLLSSRKDFVLLHLNHVMWGLDVVIILESRVH